MPLHPKIQHFLNNQPTQPSGYIQNVEEMRFQSKQLTQASSKGPSVFAVEDRVIDYIEHSIPIRIYTPGAEGPFPLLLYIHGGGFVVGDLDSHDVICRNIVKFSGHKVISVDYRLAPEHPFPAAVEDSYAALEWMIDHTEELNGDRSRISIAGDSAGGNLATVACLIARDRKTDIPLKQVLFYPVTDYFSIHEKPVYESYETYDQYGLSRLKMSEFWRHYTEQAESEATNSYMSPVQAETLEGLPPAYVVTAEYDILRDEGEAYAKRLEQDGIPVVLERVKGVNHGFLSRFSELNEAQKVFQAVSVFLNEPVAETCGFKTEKPNRENDKGA